MTFFRKSNRFSSLPPNPKFEIPRQLHFLWGFLGDEGLLLPREQSCFDRWKVLNPNWASHVKYPRDIEDLVEPTTRQLYEQLPTAIQRCDIARPMILNRVGGIYSDLDVQPFRPLDALLAMYPTARVLLVEEVTLSRASSIRRGRRFSIRNGQPELRLRVANFWMASVADHPFWQDVLRFVESRKHFAIQNDYDVIYTTGPDVISEVYHRCAHKYDDLQLVPRHIARQFFRHRTHGSWRTDGKNREFAAHSAHCIDG